MAEASWRASPGNEPTHGILGDDELMEDVESFTDSMRSAPSEPAPRPKNGTRDEAKHVYCNAPLLSAVHVVKYVPLLALCLAFLLLDMQTVSVGQGYRDYTREREMIFYGRLADALSTEVLLRASANASLPDSAVSSLEEAAAATSQLVDAGSGTLGADVGLTHQWLRDNIRGDASRLAAGGAAAAAVMDDVTALLERLRGEVLTRMDVLLGARDAAAYYHYGMHTAEKLATAAHTAPFRSDAGVGDDVRAIREAMHDLEAVTRGVGDGGGAAWQALRPILEARADALESTAAAGGAPPAAVLPRSVLDRFGDVGDHERARALREMAEYDKAQQLKAAVWIELAVVVLVSAMFVALEFYELQKTETYEASLQEGFKELEQAAVTASAYSKQIELCGEDVPGVGTDRLLSIDSIRSTSNVDLMHMYFSKCIEALKIVRPYVPGFVFTPPRQYNDGAAPPKPTRLESPQAPGKVELVGAETGSRGSIVSVRSTGSVTSGIITTTTSGILSRTESARTESSAPPCTPVLTPLGAAPPPLNNDMCRLDLRNGLARSTYVLALFDLRCLLSLPDVCETAAQATQCASAVLEALVREATANHGTLVQITPMTALLAFTRPVDAARAVMDLIEQSEVGWCDRVATDKMNAAVLTCEASAGSVSTGMHTTYLFAGGAMKRLERMRRLNSIIETKILTNATTVRALRKARDKSVDCKACSIVPEDGRRTVVFELKKRPKEQDAAAAPASPPPAPPGAPGGARGFGQASVPAAWRGHQPSAGGLGSLADAAARAIEAKKTEVQVQREWELQREKDFVAVVQQAVKDTLGAEERLHEHTRKYECPDHPTKAAPQTPKAAYLWSVLTKANERVHDADNDDTSSGYTRRNKGKKRPSLPDAAPDAERQGSNKAADFGL